MLYVMCVTIALTLNAIYVHALKIGNQMSKPERTSPAYEEAKRQRAETTRKQQAQQQREQDRQRRDDTARQQTGSNRG